MSLKEKKEDSETQKLEKKHLGVPNEDRLGGNEEDEVEEGEGGRRRRKPPTLTTRLQKKSRPVQQCRNLKTKSQSELPKMCSAHKAHISHLLEVIALVLVALPVLKKNAQAGATCVITVSALFILYMYT